MPKKLVYGGHEIGIGEDDDLAALRERIDNALNGGEGGWVDVVDQRGNTHWIRVGPTIALVVSDVAVKSRKLTAH